MFGEKIKYVNTSNDTRGVPEGDYEGERKASSFSKRSRPCPRALVQEMVWGIKGFLV